MNTYQKLEKERIDKIKDLNLDEVKSYIRNLNRKMMNSLELNDADEMEFYSKKLSEVFDLTKDKYVNLDFYSLSSRLDISIAKMIESNTKKQITYISLISQILLHSYIALKGLSMQIDYILMIYYHNYHLNETSIVEDLLINLELEYDFKDDKFSEYANNKAKKYNGMLMKELNSLIDRFKDIINHIILFTDVSLVFNDYSFDEVLKHIEFEKNYVIDNAHSFDRINTLKDGDYLDLLDTLKECYETLHENMKLYDKSKEDILNLINSDDGFLKFKERDYDFSIKTFGKAIFEKEDFIAMRPSYDMKNCEFIESSN